MKWYNKVINGLTAGILLGSLLIPLDKGIASASAGPNWTKYPGEISFVPEQKNVTDASVIKDGSTYRMWYTHTTNDKSLLDLLSNATTVIPKTVVADLFSLNFPEFLNGLGSVTSANLWNLLTDSTGYSTAIGYATSTNGTSWTVVNSNAVTGSNGILGSVSAPSVIKEGDTSYKMWFTRNKTTLTQSSLQTILTNLGNPAQRNAAFSQIFQSFSTVIGYATSTDGSSWTLPTEVIAGSNGVMDSVSAPSVIKDGSTYKMWYSRMKTDVVQADIDALAGGNATADSLWNILDGTGSVIRYATSTDGISWGPVVDHPEALTAGAGFWDSVGSPSVIQGAGYEMWYTRGQTDFTAAKLTTLFTEAAKLVDPGWNILNAYQTGNLTALLNGMQGLDVVPIKGLLSDTGTSIGYATSGNGTSFTEQDARNLTGASNATWASVASPGVIKDADACRLWYTRGIDDLTSQNLLDLVSGTKLTMGYAYFYCQPPSVVTDNATSVGQTIATLNGNLTSMGTASTVNVSFEYGLNTNYGSTINADTPSMTANGTFSAPLTGLAAKTTYHFRAKAVGDLTVYGNDTTFITLTVLPTVVTVKADSIGMTSADLYGNLTSKGTATTVVVSFDYGLTNIYGSTTNTTSVSAIGPFFAQVGGLTANTTYHFRAKAVGDGTANGSDMTFTTKLPSVVVTPENSTEALYSGHVQVVQFNATFIQSDTLTQPVTDTANWTSSNTTVGTFTGSTLTVLGVGTSVINATYNGTVGNTTLTVLPDTTPPVLTLNSPSSGITISANSLNVTGMVDDTAATVTATVNGDVGNATTLTLVNGTFDKAITLKNGTNQIIVKAIDPAGNVGTSGTRTVTVTPTAPGPEAETPKFNLWWLALAISAVLIIIGLVFWQKSKHRQP